MIRPVAASCAAVVLAAVLSGCVATVNGSAVQAREGGPQSVNVPTLAASDLDGVLLSVGAVNGIMDATGIRQAASSEDMSDNSDAVSDIDCLGAIYGAPTSARWRAGTPRCCPPPPRRGSRAPRR